MAAPRGVSAFRPDQLWQLAREPIFWLDHALRLTWVNRAWEELTGQPAAAVVGQPSVPMNAAEFSAVADLVASFAPPAEAVGGHPTGTLTIIVRDDGERLWRRLEFWPLRDPEGKLMGLLGQVRDPAAPASVPDSRAQQLHVQLLQLRDRLRRPAGLELLLGTGPAHARLLEQVRLAASCSAPVLIMGEPGTGKRLVGRVIHDLGRSRGGPIIPIDCEALPAEVIERELRKLRQATAPGAKESLPDNAAPVPPTPTTLLIGDVLSLPRDLQLELADLLAADASVRVMATTVGDPEAAVAVERLRPELYHALTVLVLRLRPLRERGPDLPILAQHLLERADQRTGVSCRGFDPQAIAVLKAYDWPGNVSELERVVAAAHERAQSRPRGDSLDLQIDSDDLPAGIRGHLGAAFLPPPATRAIKPLDELLTEIERRLIETALTRARQNKSRAAELLGISRPRLYRRIKELNIPDDSEPEAEPQPAATPATL